MSPLRRPAQVPSRRGYAEILCIPALMLFHRLAYDLVGTLHEGGTRDLGPWLETPLDRAIPFVALFSIPYLFAWVYPLLVPAYVALTRRYHKQLFRSIYLTFFTMTVAEALLWWLLPARISIRVPVSSLAQHGWLGDLTGYAYGHATPWNVMPSGHIAFAYLTWLLSRHFARRADHWFFLAMCVLICASTLLIRNHFVLDVFGGLLVGHLAYLCVFRPAFRSRLLSGFSTLGVVSLFLLLATAMALVHTWVTA